VQPITGRAFGEAAGLRWRQFDRDADPLGRLFMEKTKSFVPHRVPVHPALAHVLAECNLAGWERTHGRRPYKTT
jgi:hypothetical protein